jgi:hypothetical protein
MGKAAAIRDGAIALREDNIQAMTVAFLRWSHAELAFQLATAFYTVVDLDREAILLREQWDDRTRRHDRAKPQEEFSKLVTQRHRPMPAGLKLWHERRKQAAQKIIAARAAGLP